MPLLSEYYHTCWSDVSYTWMLPYFTRCLFYLNTTIPVGQMSLIPGCYHTLLDASFIWILPYLFRCLLYLDATILDQMPLLSEYCTILVQMLLILGCYHTVHDQMPLLPGCYTILDQMQSYAWMIPYSIRWSHISRWYHTWLDGVKYLDSTILDQMPLLPGCYTILDQIESSTWTIPYLIRWSHIPGWYNTWSDAVIQYAWMIQYLIRWSHIPGWYHTWSDGVIYLVGTILDQMESYTWMLQYLIRCSHTVYLDNTILDQMGCLNWVMIRVVSLFHSIALSPCCRASPWWRTLCPWLWAPSPDSLDATILDQMESYAWLVQYLIRWSEIPGSYSIAANSLILLDEERKATFAFTPPFIINNF
jgi:hypothetical protein